MMAMPLVCAINKKRGKQRKYYLLFIYSGVIKELTIYFKKCLSKSSFEAHTYVTYLCP